MTAVTLINTNNAATKECSSEKKTDSDLNGLFNLLFSSISDTDSNIDGKKDAKGTEDNTESCLEGSLIPLLSYIGFNITVQSDEQQINTVNTESTGLSLQSITDILESNNLTEDMDIDSLLTKIQSYLEQSDSEGIETVMARMPQIIETLQKSGDNAVKEDDLLYNNSYPLENTSDGSMDVLSKNILSAENMSMNTVDLSEKADVNTSDLTENTALNTSTYNLTENTGLNTDNLPETAILNTSNIYLKESVYKENKVSDTSKTNVTADSESKNMTGISEETGNTDISLTAAQSGEDTADGFTSSEEDNTDLLSEQIQKTSDESDVYLPAADNSSKTLAVSNTLTEVSSAAQTAAGNALNWVADTISSYEQQGDRQLEIQLEPEYLGKLSISLSMGKKGITAQIRTVDAGVQSALASQINTLVDKLSESGIHVDSVNVMCTDLGWQGTDMQNSGNGNTGQNYPGKWFQEAAKNTEAYEDTDIYDIYTDIESSMSSVEYRV